MFKVNNVSVFVNIYSTHLRNRKYVFKGNAVKCDEERRVRGNVILMANILTFPFALFK